MVMQPASQRSDANSDRSLSNSAQSPRTPSATPPRLAGWLRWAVVALVCASLLPLAGRPSLALAASITVTTTIDEDNGSLGGGTGISLREAMLYSVGSDVISLPAGTYNLTIAGGGNDDGKKGDLDVFGKAITISGAGAATTKIVASASSNTTNARDRVIQVLGGASLTISGVTISGGTTSSPGGGIRNQGTLILSNVVVSNNASVIVESNKVSGNSGGGIANEGTATISDSEIKGNTAKSSGGGIYNAAGATLTIDKSTIANNVTNELNGGGIANDGTLTVANSTLSSNSSNRSGGGLYNNGTSTVSNSTITGNICNADSRQSGNGGGAFNNSATVGSLTFRNSIIAGNTDLLSPPNPNLSQSNFPDLNAQTANTIVGNSNNLIGSRAGINGSTSIGTAGQSDIVSANFGLGALGNNGGPTLTHLPLSTSPALDAAKTATCTSAPVSNLDQRGRTRPADSNGDSSAICEIGAVEVQSNIVLLDDATPIANGGGFNFGSTPRDTPITRTLTVQNTGEATLLIGQGSLSLPAGFASAGGFASSSIAPGDTTTLTIQYNAATLGAASGALTFGTNDPDSTTFSVNLSGTATNKAATIVVANGTTGLADGAELDFGTTTVGNPVDKVLTITNGGDEALNLGAITVPTGFVIQSPLGSTSLAANASTSFTVRMNATATGAPAGTLTIPSNASNTASFQLLINGNISGSTTDQLVVIDTTAASEVPNGGSVNFGATVVGTPITRTFTLENIGNRNLVINAPLTLPAGFSLVGSFSTTTLTPGQSVDVSIKANATAVGSPSGTVSIVNDDSNENPFTFTASATVGASPARIGVFEGDAPIADNTGSVSYGTTTIGTPVVKTFTIRNTGGVNLTLSAPTLPAGFTLVNPFSTTVAPGATTSFQVRLNATAVGSFGGNISFANSDSTASPYNFAVSGTVTSLPPNITVAVGATSVISGSSVIIGPASVGAPVSKTFTIKNTGGVTLQINSINVPTGFTRDSSVTTADTLAPGASTTFVVVLNAESVGSFDGQVTVRTNDPSKARFSFTVSGTVNRSKVYLPAVQK